jgi:SAM-dependent methyltransferase
MNKPGNLLQAILSHPKLRGISLDDPETTAIRKDIILTNSFLRRIYEKWYSAILPTIPDGDGQVLELGSGAGFLDRSLPLITSEVFYCRHVKTILNGQALPFANGSLRAIVMTDVLHHIPDARLFFQEAARCIRPDGVISMTEPWVTAWSKIIYTHLHHEPFDPAARDWSFPSGGPLSGANGALPWILFSRDRLIFEREFPMWQIVDIHPMMPILYLISGGVSMRQLMPGWSFGVWSRMEKLLSARANPPAMFAQIVLKRV